MLGWVKASYVHGDCLRIHSTPITLLMMVIYDLLLLDLVKPQSCVS